MSDGKNYRLQDSLPVFDFDRTDTDLCARRKSILVVEDEEDLNLALAYFLRSHGYHVVSSFDAVSALAKTGFHRPDLVLLDLVQPGTDGFAFLGEFCQVSRLRDVPVIVMTAFDDPETLAEAANLGVHEIVLKPLDREALLREITALIGAPTSQSA